MRWYYIKFTPSGNAPNIKDFPLEYGSSQPSQNLFNPNGVNLPGALEIEFDATVSSYDQYAPNGQLKIYNPPISVIKHADAYNGMAVTLSGGFATYDNVGYPLAKVALAGPLAYGRIAGSYANWVGGDMCVNFIFASPLDGTPEIGNDPNSSAKFQFRWSVGQSFEDAIKSIFTQFNYNLIFELNPVPQQPGYEIGLSSNDIVSMSTQIRRLTAILSNSTYLNGVTITKTGPKDLLISNSFLSSIVEIEPGQIIGQPTLSFSGGDPKNGGFFGIQSVHPLRSDIIPGNQIKLNGAVLNFTPGPAYGYNSLNMATKTLYVQKVRHVGRFRDASQQGWVTVVESKVNLVA